MKIHNETKIGILAVVGVLALILGFNFLKGKSFFKEEKHIYAVFDDIQKLNNSDAVMVNGLQIGHVSDLNGKDLRKIVVTIDLTKDVQIPDNSLAVIEPNPLGTTTLEIKLGSGPRYLQPGDTLVTSLSGGAFDEALKMLNPVLYEVRNAVKSLDSVLHIITNVFDPETKNNIRGIVANLNTVTASFTQSAASLQVLLNTQNGALAKSLGNMNSFTNNLAANNSKFNSIIGNAEKASNNLAALDLQHTLSKLDSAASELKQGVAQVNNRNNSLGLLLNDTKLYDNLSATSNKINILLDDIRVHPKRYISISVFGKKDKGNYLTSPLVDDSTKSPRKVK